MRRTQIYLDEAQDRRLSERATAAGVSKSTLIRTAIDAFLQSQDREAAQLDAFRNAVAAVAGAAPDLPPGAEYVRTMRANDRERHERLEARRRG